MPKFKQECIFGLRAVIEAIQQGKEIDKVMFGTGTREGELFQQLFALVREREIPYQYVPVEVFRSFNGKNHQGVLAEVSPIAYQEIEEIVDRVIAAGERPLVLILDRVTDVRNLGGIARTAECAGVHALLIPSRHSAKISSDAIKTSAGALYHLPVCRKLNLKKVIRTLRHKGLLVYAAHERGEKEYTEVPMDKGCAIILGAEDTGINEELLRFANEQVRVPLLGKIESLNVSAAAAIVLYEAVRQRRQAKEA
ncbi:MAG: 23S rRNA (guanosine(2251)-2'-O)-methyltransferase RlmB [Odoribacteraceae bacterium]|jgi:23S rRNA (guanosine2251-2'-O)-methyltransferase|nr:23S rRNA (guanosine(2251)-2'-O)-methyltransferase RlmB [Odoribacteraceae bacterium]